MSAEDVAVSRTPQRVAVVGWAALFLAFCLTRGFPLDRTWLLLWLLTLLVAFRVGQPWREQGRIVLDWLPFLAVLYAYDLSRGVADTLGMPVHVGGVVAAEAALFQPLLGGEVPTVWLQQHLYEPSTVHWYDVAASLVYLSHFFVTWVLAAVLYVRSRQRWASWMARVVALSVAGLVTYVLLPAAPPWYAAQQGLIDPVARTSARGWSALDLHFAGTFLERLQAGGNDVAAIPSLHTAFAALVVVFLWPVVRSWWGRALLVGYALAMVVSLVYTGEHYVVDALVGWVYVALVVAAVGAWERWREARRVVDLTEAGVPSTDASVPASVGS